VPNLNLKAQCGRFAGQARPHAEFRRTDGVHQRGDGQTRTVSVEINTINAQHKILSTFIFTFDWQVGTLNWFLRKAGRQIQNCAAFSIR
jgi:hypothetical protein